MAGQQWEQRQQRYQQQPARGVDSILDGIQVSETGRPVLDEMPKVLAWARWMRGASMVNSSFQTDEAVAIAIMAGRRLGFDELQGPQNIAVVGRQPRLWGVGMLAVLTRNMPAVVQQFSARWQLDGNDIAEDTVPDLLDAQGNHNVCCVVTHQRVGMPAGETSYSVRQAIQAGLWWGRAQAEAKRRYDKGGESERAAADSPWRKNPVDMLRWKARWRAALADFADLLLGMPPAEDAEVLDRIDWTVSARPIQRPGRPTTAAAATAPEPAGGLTTELDPGEQPISAGQAREFWALARGPGAKSDAEVRGWLDSRNLASTKAMPACLYAEACEWAREPADRGKQISEQREPGSEDAGNETS